VFELNSAKPSSSVVTHYRYVLAPTPSPDPPLGVGHLILLISAICFTVHRLRKSDSVAACDSGSPKGKFLEIFLKKKNPRKFLPRTFKVTLMPTLVPSRLPIPKMQ
jgi:hypothetical protein